MKRRMTGVFAALLLTASVSSADATVINTGISTSISAFGETYTGASTYGQTFSLNPGDDTSLDSVSFYLNDYVNPDYVDFAFYLYEWDGTKITGSSLFTSGMMSTTGQSGYETFTVNTGGVNLTAGTDYAFFVSASNFFDGSYGTGFMAGATDAYANGQFIFMFSGNDFSLLNTTSWNLLFTNIDLAFDMQLSPSSQVPEPSTLLLLGSGLAGLGVVRRLRRK